MNKKNLLFLISALFLLLQGTHATVNESAYAWRLDSIIYDYPVLSGADSSLGELRYVRYNYGERSVEVLGADTYKITLQPVHRPPSHLQGEQEHHHYAPER